MLAEHFSLLTPGVWWPFHKIQCKISTTECCFQPVAAYIYAAYVWKPALRDGNISKMKHPIRQDSSFNLLHSNEHKSGFTACYRMCQMWGHFTLSVVSKPANVDLTLDSMRFDSLKGNLQMIADIWWNSWYKMGIEVNVNGKKGKNMVLGRWLEKNYNRILMHWDCYALLCDYN